MAETLTWEHVTGTKSPRPYHYAYAGKARVGSVVFTTLDAADYPRGAYEVNYRGRQRWVGGHGRGGEADGRAARVNLPAGHADRGSVRRLAASLQVRSGGAIDLWGGCREWATCSDDDM
jgi:hypothetical protein